MMYFEYSCLRILIPPSKFSPTFLYFVLHDELVGSTVYTIEDR